jgi:hypothetical protein
VERHPEDVTVVTTAGRSGSDDRRLRQRRYAQTQALRLLCFVLAVALPVPLPVRLVLIVGAFALPWIGVVNANGGPSRAPLRAPDALIDRPEPVRIALEPGRDIDADDAG